MQYIKSPLNYTGGKYKILPQIYPLFPEEINCFVDLFTGGANVGINAEAQAIILNDNLFFLMDLYDELRSRSIDETVDYVESTIAKYELSKTNAEAYNNFRDYYNMEQKPLDLMILIFFAFNHQVRFNGDHKYNVPFGKNRSCYNARIEKNLRNFVAALQSKNIRFSKKDYRNYEFDALKSDDFVYCDPPYLITTGTYNDGKRGFTGWTSKEEKKLLEILSSLNERGIKFALSNVLIHKNQKNELLLEWIEKFRLTVYHISNDFTNSSYHASDRDASHTDEVLITNY